MTSFIGRHAELVLLAEMLDHRRLICITGVGGCGKTRLALAGVETSTASFDCVIFVDVSSCTDDSSLAATMVSAFGERPAPGLNPADVLNATIGDDRSLLVLDNCEHIVEAVGALVERLLVPFAALVVVCTSREPLGLEGEAVLRVPPLGLPPVGPPATGACGAHAVTADAFALFVDRARLADATFDADEVWDTIARICHRLDGLPLAIELAAARVGVLSVDDIEAGLHDRFRLLAGGPRTATLRHRSMRACLEWSTQLLADADRTVLERLSVFPGSWTLEAARAVVADDEIADDLVIEAVYRLVDRSLVTLDGASGRYRLLETIRDHAAEGLQHAAGRDAVAGRLLEHVRARCAVAQHALERDGLDVEVRDLAADHDQLVVAFDHATACGRVEVMWELFNALAFYWTSTGQFDEAARWFAECTLRPSASLAATARGQWVASYTAVYSGRYDAAIELAASAVALGRQAGDPSTEARGLDVLGFAGVFHDPSGAYDRLCIAADLAEQAGDDWCASDAAQILGYLLISSSRLAEAQSWLERASVTAERLGNPQLLAWDAAGRALLTMLRGRDDEVVHDFEMAGMFAARTGDPNITGCVLAWSAMYAAWCGDAAPWIEPVRAGLERCARVGAAWAVPSLARTAIEVCNSAEEYDESERVWARFTDPIRELAPSSFPAFAVVAATTAWSLGDEITANERLNAARIAAASRDNLIEVAFVDTISAWIALNDGDTRRAERLASGATGALQHCDVVAYQHDLALVWAAINERAGRTDDANVIAQAAAAGAPAAWRSAVTTTMVGHFTRIPTANTMSLPDALGYAIRGRTRGIPHRFGWTGLTPTERRVVDLASAGLTNAAIGRHLHIGAGTVKTHLAHIYAKLGVANRTELAVDATRRLSDD